MVNIPIKESPAYSEIVQLDGSSYYFQFEWNTRGEFWAMTISDINRVQLIAGVKVILDYELIHDHPGLGLPPGEIWAVDPGETLTRVGRDDLGELVKLVYVTEAEL